MSKQRKNRIELKYGKVKDSLRRLDRRFLTTEESTELAYRIHKIESYGFEFAPSFYVWDDVEELSVMTRSLLKQQKEKTNGEG